MHDVNMRTRHLGERHEMMNTFRFHHRRPAPIVPFGSGLAFAEELLLQLRHQIRVLAMRGGNHA